MRECKKDRRASETVEHRKEMLCMRKERDRIRRTARNKEELIEKNGASSGLPNNALHSLV